MVTLVTFGISLRFAMVTRLSTVAMLSKLLDVFNTSFIVHTRSQLCLTSADIFPFVVKLIPENILHLSLILG